MAYDAVAKLTILIGGKSAGNAYRNDTWAYDGVSWRPIGEKGPSPRAWTAFAYDSDREAIVLHGGRDSTGTALADTWERRGTGWKLVSTRGPAARDHHAMAYDAARKQILMFGGYNRQTRVSSNNTWGWDGQLWAPLASEQKPGPRDAHGLTFVPSRNEVILFGGMNAHDGETTIWGDTWSWNGQEWYLLSDDRGEGRSHLALVYDEARGCVLRFGGGDPNRTPLGATWRFDKNRWQELSMAGPSARVDHAMVFDIARKKIVRFGGYLPGAEGSIFGDTWEWDGERWEQK
jgi:hypothetical protein